MYTDGRRGSGTDTTEATAGELDDVDAAPSTAGDGSRASAGDGDDEGASDEALLAAAPLMGEGVGATAGAVTAVGAALAF